MILIFQNKITSVRITKCPKLQKLFIQFKKLKINLLNSITKKISIVYKLIPNLQIIYIQIKPIRIHMLENTSKNSKTSK